VAFSALVVTYAGAGVSLVMEEIDFTGQNRESQFGLARPTVVTRPRVWVYVKFRACTDLCPRCQCCALEVFNSKTGTLAVLSNPTTKYMAIPGSLSYSSSERTEKIGALPILYHHWVAIVTTALVLFPRHARV
jgi:hypothetical protein